MKIWKKILTGILVGAMTIGMTGVVPVEEAGIPAAEAAGAVNILDYETNKTASEFAIYDVEGMEYLAELVNEKKITFDGKTITLENDLEYDKTKENNHTPIGKNQRFFGGIFDGKNHVIKGININTTDGWAVGGRFLNGRFKLR